ncbi:MAG: hypothetical protein JW709_11740 [Sedimentisphaerales bacterium]|nr:hypothetical protein [Sedimentisphaerales bacterium]
MRTRCKVVMLMLLLCSAAMGYENWAAQALPIAGQPIIDGVISTGEWDNAVWIPISTVYADGGQTLDITSAKYAVMWSSDTNLMYVAVKVSDPCQIFTPAFVSEFKADSVQVFIDAANSNATGQLGVNDAMQQWIIGNDGSGGSWAVLGPAGAAATDLAAYATGIDGNTVVYEVAMNPYSYYNSGGGSTTISLGLGTVSGVDVVINTVDEADDPNYVQLAHDANGPKNDDAGTLMDHVMATYGECLGFSVCDFNQDCMVNLVDFVVLADQWLLENTAAPLLTNPGPTDLVGTWYSAYNAWNVYYTYQIGASVGCEFEGTSIRWRYVTFGNGADHAEIYIDGDLVDTISQTGADWGGSHWETEGLDPGRHTIAIKNAFTDPATNAMNCVFDPPAFTFLNPGELTPTLGTWYHWNTWYYSFQTDATISTDFSGTQIRFNYVEYTNSGIVEVLIDDVSQGNVDQWGPVSDVFTSVLYDGLADTDHTITIRHTGTNSYGGPAGEASANAMVFTLE